MTILLVKPLTNGTWRLDICRDGNRPVMHRTGITSKEDALKRAGIVAEACGYTIKVGRDA
jgi:hypothetical protein